MQLPRKIQAGSAARDAEDEAKARRSESLSLYGSGARSAGQPLRLSPRASSAPQAVPREEYVRNAEIKVTGTGGQKFEKRTAAEPQAPAPAPPAAAEPGLLASVLDRFLKLFRWK
jgi:hypothetical protein